MSERTIPVTKVVRLGTGELSQVQAPIVTPPIVALAVLLLVGTAWWAATRD